MRQWKVSMSRGRSRLQSLKWWQRQRRPLRQVCSNNSLFARTNLLATSTEDLWSQKRIRKESLAFNLSSKTLLINLFAKASWPTTSSKDISQRSSLMENRLPSSAHSSTRTSRRLFPQTKHETDWLTALKTMLKTKEMTSLSYLRTMSKQSSKKKMTKKLWCPIRKEDTEINLMSQPKTPMKRERCVHETVQGTQLTWDRDHKKLMRILLFQHADILRTKLRSIDFMKFSRNSTQLRGLQSTWEM